MAEAARPRPLPGRQALRLSGFLTLPSPQVQHQALLLPAPELPRRALILRQGLPLLLAPPPQPQLPLLGALLLVSFAPRPGLLLLVQLPVPLAPRHALPPVLPPVAAAPLRVVLLSLPVPCPVLAWHALLLLLRPTGPLPALLLLLLGCLAVPPRMQWMPLLPPALPPPVPSLPPLPHSPLAQPRRAAARGRPHGASPQCPSDCPAPPRRTNQRRRARACVAGPAAAAPRGSAAMQALPGVMRHPRWKRSPRVGQGCQFERCGAKTGSTGCNASTPLPVCGGRCWWM